MYQNAIYICISWYNKICWFPLKNADVSRNQGLCHVIHISFWSSLGKIYLPSLIIVGYVWQIIGRGCLFAPRPPSPIRDQPPKCPSWIGLKQNEISIFCKLPKEKKRNNKNVLTFLIFYFLSSSFFFSDFTFYKVALCFIIFILSLCSNTLTLESIFE